MAALGAHIWMRDDAWRALAPGAPALLALFPVAFMLGRPWSRVDEPAPARPGATVAGGALLVGGTLLGSTLALALGWAALLGLILERAGVRTSHPRPAALLALAALGFPWLATDLAGLAWPLRTSSASAAAAVLSALGSDVQAQGPLLRLRGVVVSVDASCSGLGALQACLVLAAIGYARPGPAARSPAALAGAACGLAWAANVMRLVGITAIASTLGVGVARGEAHAATGLAALLGPAALLALYARPRAVAA